MKAELLLPLFRSAFVLSLCVSTASYAQEYTVSFDSTTATVVQGGAVNARIVLRNTPDAVTGFSLGVQHDASLLSLDSVELGADVLNVVGAACPGGDPDPSFLAINESPAGGDGVTIALLLRTMECADGALPPGDSTNEIVALRYTASADMTGTADVSITGELGDPKVEVVLDLAGVTQLPTSDADTTLTVTVNEAGAGNAPYLRGDVNQSGRIEISDGILILNFLFADGLPAGEETKNNCLVAYNFDGTTSNGTEGQEDASDINLADGVSLLNFLFVAGSTPPPPPAGACGQADNPASEDMACDAFGC